MRQLIIITFGLTVVGVGKIEAGDVSEPTSAPQHQLAIRLWPTATVVGEDIRLADICQTIGFDLEREASIDALVIQPAPRPGEGSEVSMDSVREVLAGTGINKAAIRFFGSSSCDVRRPMALRDDTSHPGEATSDSKARQGRSLRTVIHDWYRSSLAVDRGELELVFGNAADPFVDLAEPQFEFRIHHDGPAKLGLLNLSVDVLQNGTQIQRLQMAIDARLRVAVAVARRPINSRALIGSDDVVLEPRTYTDAETIGVTRLDSLIGQQARRFLPAGTTIQAEDVEPQPLVRRGQLVEVRISSGGIEVETVARATAEGRYGETIELRTSDRRSERLHGVVVASGRVELFSNVHDGSTMMALAKE